MTEVDTSREAVERLAAQMLSDADALMRGITPHNQHPRRAAVTLRALRARAERAEAERSKWTGNYMKAAAERDAALMASETAVKALADMQADLAAARAEAARMRSLLRRYRTETPLGHQPHMIAHEVDAALTQEPGHE